MNQAKMARPQIANDSSQQDFVLLCSLADRGDGLAEAVHALYYLPQNYKLVVRAGAAVSPDEITKLMTNSAIMDRIRFEETTGQAEQASPFSYVINNEAVDSVTIESSDHRVVTVSARHPEAFASAMLNLTRAQA
jgi:hypothetical protein